MEGIDRIMRMPISTNAKIELLVNEYGYTPEMAAAIVAPEGSKNDMLEKLKSMNPSLATKIMDKMGEGDVPNLLR